MSDTTKAVAFGNRYVLQAISVIPADNMIRVAIRRALGYRHGYSHKTWLFRFPRCFATANDAIREGRWRNPKYP